jgi:hypothetical protein
MAQQVWELTMVDGRKVATASPAVVVSALILLSFLLIAGQDVYCGGTMNFADPICGADSLASAAFPHPLLYFLEDWIGSRLVQRAVLFALDLAVIATLFSLPALRQRSIRAAIFAFIAYVVVSAVFFLLILYLYLVGITMTVR